MKIEIKDEKILFFILRMLASKGCPDDYGLKLLGNKDCDKQRCTECWRECVGIKIIEK